MTFKLTSVKDGEKNVATYDDLEVVTIVFRSLTKSGWNLKLETQK